MSSSANLSVFASKIILNKPSSSQGTEPAGTIPQFKAHNNPHPPPPFEKTEKTLNKLNTIGNLKIVKTKQSNEKFISNIKKFSAPTAIKASASPPIILSATTNKRVRSPSPVRKHDAKIQFTVHTDANSNKNGTDLTAVSCAQNRNTEPSGGTHKCSQCSMVFFDFDQLQLHIGIEHDNSSSWDIASQQTVPLPNSNSSNELAQCDDDNDNSHMPTAMVCGMCGENFFGPDDRDLQAHINAVHATSTFDNLLYDDEDECETCGKQFPSSISLWYHIKDNHLDPSTLPATPYCETVSCLICKPELRLLTRSFSCQLCRTAYPTRTLLDKHYLAEHEDIGKKEIDKVCRVCFKLLVDVDRRLIHEANLHYDDATEMYECNRCPFQSSAMNDIVAHMATEHKLWICHQCNCTAETYDEWMVHVIRHAVEFRSKFPATVAEPRDLRDLRCQICFKVFVGQRNLRQHENEEHVDAKTGRYCCASCYFETDDLKALRKHNVVHMTKALFMCETCGQRFFEKTKLATHMQRHHKKLGHKCSICGKMFKYKWENKRHELYHTDLRPYQCHLCDKTYKGLTDLRRHKWSHGIGEAKIECPMCPKKFYEAKQLRHHNMRCHTEK